MTYYTKKIQHLFKRYGHQKWGIENGLICILVEDHYVVYTPTIKDDHKLRDWYQEEVKLCMKYHGNYT